MTRTVALYAVTALAELLGCWLVWRWLKQDGSAWWLIPAAASLASFAWLLTLHDAPSGRVFAAYGAVYVVMAVGWLWCGSMASGRPAGMSLAALWCWQAWRSSPSNPSAERRVARGRSSKA